MFSFPWLEHGFVPVPWTGITLFPPLQSDPGMKTGMFDSVASHKWFVLLPM